MTDKQLAEECQIALKHDVASVCIKPYAVTLARDLLADSQLEVGTVIGFPHGNSRADIKIRETELAINDGATEIDMVVNIGKVLSQDWDYVSAEIGAINEVTVNRGAILKVIFENDFLLEDNYKIRLCQICSEIGVAFVKTSSGYGFVKQPNGMYTYHGATDHDLVLMRNHSAPEVQVKAAGGVRNLDDVLRVRELGVTRIGATATEAILMEAKKRGYQ
jgi:deoxyribose-phosphate aldolase